MTVVELRVPVPPEGGRSAPLPSPYFFVGGAGGW